MSTIIALPNSLGSSLCSWVGAGFRDFWSEAIMVGEPAPTVIWANAIAYFRVTKIQSSNVFTISAFCKPRCFKTGFSNRK